jgi:glycosyl transferase, family 25
VLKTYCINLDHRADRWEEASRNYEAFGVPTGSVTRWSAVADNQFGACGCAKSHVAALAHFLTQESAPWCLILEDDFDFVRPWGEFVESFNKLVAEKVEWDALLLMGTAAIAYEPLACGFARIFEARSAAAYMVTRKYAATLLGCFAEAVPHLEAMREIGNRDFVTMRFAIDMVWQRLQRRDRWFIGTPTFGRQRPSFSDIEQRHVNYDNMTYGLAAVE